MSEAKVWPGDRSLLIVDDDAPLRMRLARAMETRGFMVSAAENVAEGVELAMENPPAYAVIDLRLDDGNGFEVVQAIQEAKPDCRIVMLTGYGNIATAVAAIKAGAVSAKIEKLTPDAPPGEVRIFTAADLAAAPADAPLLGLFSPSHMTYMVDHEVTEASLPESIHLAYDGLRVSW